MAHLLLLVAAGRRYSSNAMVAEWCARAEAAAGPHPCILHTSTPPHVRTLTPHLRIALSHRVSTPPQLLRLAKLATVHVKPMKGAVGNLLRIVRMMFIYTLVAHWVSVSKCK